MEKRLLLAFALSIAVLVGYSMLFPQPKPVTDGTVAGTEPSVETEQKKTGQAVVQQEKLPAKPAMEYTEVPEKEVTIDTDLYTAVLTTRGGVIKSWRLKEYKDAEGKPIEMVQYADGVMPLLVVPEGMTPEAALGMGYRVEGGDIDLKEKEESSISLVYASPDGMMSITKKLTFRRGTYAFDLVVQEKGVEKYGIYTGESFGSLTTKQSKGYGYTGPLTYIDGEFMDKGFMNWVGGIFKSKEEKEAPVKRFSGKSGWVGMTDKYFLAAIVTDGAISAVVDKGATDWGYVGLESSSKEGPLRARFFAGPKEYDRLKAIGSNLQDSVGFGFFAFIAKPLFVALKFFQGIVGNYGWSIIIITFIIKILFAPLTHKQQKSMKRMQKLQPKIQELKEKYKGDAQKMNMEMMELYKREKVNPLGGCLPMVIQIPVFIALYNVLNNAIELRQSPFIWWLTDLSAKDPYYILPILMGASMFVMQKMTPTTADPTQAKIMMAMPVVLTVMFISLPSGLVLYFTVSNLLSMAQQLYINRTAED